MMSLNYSAAEFLKIMMTLNFEKFEDGCDLIGPIRLIRHFGWFKGNYFLNLMESYIEKKTGDGQKPGNGRATFRDLVEKYGDRHFKRLYVFGPRPDATGLNKLGRSFPTRLHLMWP